MARGERVLFHLPVLWMCCSLPSLTSGWACHHFCKICVFSPILESQRFKHSPQEEATLRIPGFTVQAEEMGQMLCYGLSLHYWKNNSTCSLVLLKWKTLPKSRIPSPTMEPAGSRAAQIGPFGNPHTNPKASNRAHGSSTAPGLPRATATPHPPAHPVQQHTCYWWVFHLYCFLFVPWVQVLVLQWNWKLCIGKGLHLLVWLLPLCWNSAQSQCLGNICWA